MIVQIWESSLRGHYVSALCLAHQEKGCELADYHVQRSVRLILICDKGLGLDFSPTSLPR